MRFKLLGRSGLRVSELCLGTMTFGEDWGWGASKDVSYQMFKLFSDAGGNFIDTANLYTNGTSEKFTGEFIAANREEYVLATKYTLTLRPKDVNGGGNHRKNLVQSVNSSLKRLQTDYIDLLWLHAWDFMTPVEEVMRALDDLVRTGKILYAGISDTPAWIVSQANTVAMLQGWTPFVGLQIQYSLIERNVERELLPMAKALDLAVTPWGAIGGGVLTGKYRLGQARPKGTRYSEGNFGDQYINDRNLGIAEEVIKLSQQINRSCSQIAINWVRQQKRAEIIPILGARSVDQLRDNLACLDFQLTDEQLAHLDRVSQIDLGFPHDFLEMGKHFIFGETFSKIDNHRAL
jgi:aryl-alcohol dehydrogenase-like predicted oxidoreductase